MITDLKLLELPDGSFAIAIRTGTDCIATLTRDEAAVLAAGLRKLVETIDYREDAAVRALDW